MKSLYINARFLLQRPTGVQRYAYEMCRAIVRTGADIALVCPVHGEINNAYDVSELNIIRFGIGGSHLWEQCVLPFYFISKQNFLLVNFFGFGSVFFRNKVITIHDLAFLVNPSWFSKSYYGFYKIMTPLAMKTSKMILTVSKFSKQEIHRLYGSIPMEKVKVIYNAVDSGKFAAECHESDNEPPYILAVSSLDPRKNLKRLIRVFGETVSCRLKIIGEGNRIFNSDEEVLTNSNVDFLGSVPDSELLRLYSNAAALIFPSLYEGFGLPPLEAMSCRCPVLVSDIPVFREVCGDAALYFNPADSQSIRDAVQRILSITPEEKEKLIEAGLKNIDRFSWDKSAEILLHSLTEL